MELKLIIADDNALTIEGILHHVDFRSLNIEVVQVCADGASALDYAMHHDVDIIISDIKMPRLTGLEMAQKMLAHKPLMRFIFISAYYDYQFARDSIRLGALDYVEKPVDYTQLISVLSQATAKIRQERETQQLLENSRDALMQQFLQTLAHSTADVAESQLEQLTPYLNIPRDTTGFSCCIVSFPNISQLQQEYGVVYAQYQRIQLRSMLEKTFRCGYLLTCNDRDTLLVLLCVQTPTVEGAAPAVHTFWQQFQQTYAHSRLKLHVGVGRVVNSMWEVRVSYENARSLLNRGFFLDDTMLFENFPSFEENSHVPLHPFFENRFDEAIFEAICQRDKTQLTHAVDSMLSILRQMDDGCIQLFATIHATMGKLMNLFYEFDLPTETIRADAQHLLTQMDTSISHSDLRGDLLTLFSHALCTLGEGWGSSQQMLVQKAMDYIQQSYFNNNLNVSDIAQHINVSPSHLTALFKRYRNDTLINYLTHVRLKKARQLLSNTSLSIREISERVGFSSQYYFSACYKRHMGVSPSEERTESREKCLYS